MRAFCRIAARGGRAASAAQGGAIGPGRLPGPVSSRRPEWAARRAGGYSRLQPGLLPRAAHHERVSALAKAMFDTYSLDHLQLHRVGPDRPLFCPPGYLLVGNLLAWMRVCVLEELLTSLPLTALPLLDPNLGPNDCVPTCCPIVN
jgi:hypothetical protein